MVADPAVVPGGCSPWMNQEGVQGCSGGHVFADVDCCGAAIFTKGRAAADAASQKYEKYPKDLFADFYNVYASYRFSKGVGG